jgi:hypothetical protein
VSGGRDWLAVASGDHVARGLAEGFMQVCHGKSAPLRRLHAGDRLAYYSPGRVMGGPADLKSITAFGIVADDGITQVEMFPGFRPWRRRVNWISSRPVPVERLRADPGFILSGPGWGGKLRFGLLVIDSCSMDMIAAAMADVEDRVASC